MKKYLRRIGALLLSFIMVLSVCTSVFAETKNTATITVKNAEDATLIYAQVIEPDQTSETGWKFVNDDVAGAYIKELGASNAQDAIQKMINGADAEKLGAAQALAANKLNFTSMSNPKEVSVAGVYLVKAEEEGYTYSVMAAYIGFGVVEKDGKTYEYPSLTDAELVAKKTPTKLVKEVNDKDNVTTTGARLTYTVKAYVPYIAPTDSAKSFWVYDELTGAEYVDLDKATITLAGEKIEDYEIVPDTNSPKTKFSVDLSGMINDKNDNVGKEVVITYTVIVTSENDKITNTATAGHEGGDEYGSTTINTYEGKITLNKIDAKDNKALAGAEFEVRKDSKDSDTLNFIKLKDGSYKFVEKEIQGSTTTKIVTDENGKAIVRGLDKGTYWFKEIKAPEGYSVNTTDVSATLALDGTNSKDGSAIAVLTASATMKDTRVQPLPATGGIGTYIFTVTGVLIMAGVAGMFIISRRKEHE